MDPLFSKDSLKQTQKWLEDSQNFIPADVKFCLTILIENMLKGEQSSQGAAKGFHELLVKFGFKASSHPFRQPCVAAR